MPRNYTAIPVVFQAASPTVKLLASSSAQALEASSVDFYRRGTTLLVATATATAEGCCDCGRSDGSGDGNDGSGVVRVGRLSFEGVNSKPAGTAATENT
jgi:hypothetical protein